jgi:hypothetical protein
LCADNDEDGVVVDTMVLVPFICIYVLYSISTAYTVTRNSAPIPSSLITRESKASSSSIIDSLRVSSHILDNLWGLAISYNGIRRSILSGS